MLFCIGQIFYFLLTISNKLITEPTVCGQFYCSTSKFQSGIGTRVSSAEICVTLTACVSRGGLSLLNMSVLSSNIQKIKMDFQLIPPK